MRTPSKAPRSLRACEATSRRDPATQRPSARFALMHFPQERVMEGIDETTAVISASKVTGT